MTGRPGNRPRFIVVCMKFRTMRRKTAFAAALLAITLFIITPAFANDPPGWLRQAASVKAGSYDNDVEAVVIRDEQTVTVDESGKLITVERYALRVLNREGRDLAMARARYLASASKVQDFDAWVIYPNGTSKDYGKKETLDIIADPDDVYNEGRMKVIDATGDVDVGAVFGYEIETESTTLFYQDIWQFQSSLPTLTSRYMLVLPQGWTADSITFNHDKVTPSVNGTTYTWELDGLPPIKDELLSPSIVNIVPFIAVNFSPADPSNAVNRTFGDWKEVSVWGSGMYDPQAVVDDSVTAKAKELTAGAKTELEKIQAIGSFVQNLQYISIDIGVAYGNGYRPRPANLVLSRGYGDCKDKATLMRAMLKSLGIEAYPVAIYSGDRTFVKKEWVSPRQFNHCIIAVVIGKDIDVPTVLEAGELGRLLIFDATDDLTPVGDLPTYLQGSYALIMAGEKGGLFEMPTTDPDANSLEREVKLKLDGNGSITGSIRETSSGQNSREERMRFRRLSRTDYRKMIENWLSRGATAAKLTNLEPKDDQEEARFDLEVEFQAPTYGQLMQGRLLIFKPAVVNRLRNSYLTDKERLYPVEFDADSFSEKAEIALPEGFEVDELPDPLNLDTSFGSYNTSYEVKEGKLFFKRKLVINRSMVPAKDYEVVRDFFRKIIDAEQSPVVLLKQ